jgi:site-specific DNA-methyltransferase (adenine-specific)
MSIEILNMDCMDYMAGLEDNAFDLAIVDPPYGIGFDGKTVDDKHGWQKYEKKQWDSAIPGKDYFIELDRVSKNQIIWGGNYFTDHLAPSRCWAIWYKVPYEFSLSQAEMAWCSFSSRVRVFERMTNADRGFLGVNIHPTQKPVKLYEWLLSNYAKEGDKILDTHLGSGSSAIAAHYGGFDFVGTELDPDYFAASKKRFDAETSQIDIFAEANR